jgi:hypothetical protein
MALITDRGEHLGEAPRVQLDEMHVGDVRGATVFLLLLSNE